MEIEVEIIKGLPEKQIQKYEDRVVYNVAVITREHTKQAGAYPYLTGELARQEAAAQIVGSDKEYGLAAGVDYAVNVWKMKNVNWTNPRTEAQWYYAAYTRLPNVILQGAKSIALKEI